MATSFATDIRPLFRHKDVAAMKSAGGFDLSSYDDVFRLADGIFARLKEGDMPCDGTWPSAHVKLFEDWIGDGKQP
ncbi:MAG: hypothetical protein JO111_18765 [Caulobacteraceae bacterium]|nr:hypothetical protein [Caulobacteraceae bacterium]